MTFKWRVGIWSMWLMLGIIVFAGCGDDEQQFDCEHDDHCLSHEACIGEVCVDAPNEGDSCPEAQEGEEYEELICEDGLWQQIEVIEPATLAVAVEPPETVISGQSFEVAFDVLDEDENVFEEDDVTLTVALNQGVFATGESEATVSTGESGRAEFELIIDEPDTSYVLAASADHETLDGVSVETDPFDVVEPPTMDITYVTQPPQEVTAGEVFDVSAGLLDGDQQPFGKEGIEVTLTLDEGEFADGTQESVASTNEFGVTEFELTIEKSREDLMLTATADHEEFVGLSVPSEPFDVVAAEAAPDNSSITGEDAVIADGEQEAQITIELFDEFENPLVGKTPEFAATGEGNEYGPCSDVDADGVALCSMTSTQAGEKTLEITSPVEVVGETIEFIDCAINDDCDGDNVCNPSTSECVQCLDATHCSGNSICTEDNACICQRHVYTASGDSTARRLDSDGDEIWSFTDHDSGVEEIAVDSAGNVYTASRDYTARKLDSDGDEVWSFIDHDERVMGIAVDDQGYVYTGSRDDTARKLDSDGNEVWSFTNHSGSINDIAVDNQGNVYTASFDTTARKIDSDGNEVWSFGDHAAPLWGIAVDGEGNVFTASLDDTARKIDSDGNEVWSFTKHGDSVWDIAVDDQGYVYTASEDNTARKIDSDGNEVWSFTGHNERVRSITVDDQGHVYTSAYDDTVRKLDSDGNELWSFTEHTDVVRGIAVDPGLYATYDNECQPVVD